jgi:3-hydroxyisobutyrate dehydrogenase-like beta-hydroxyacid dehydrogenase
VNGVSELKSLQRIGIIGFGEAGSILAEDLVRAGLTVTAYDILFDSPATQEPMFAKVRAANVRAALTLRDAMTAAELVISSVTATASTQVAKDASASLAKGQLFLDINSVSPATKRENARLVEASGAQYVEAAVMAPVPGKRLAVPMLLGGPHAAQVARVLNALGMDTTAVDGELGVASAVKMCRSIIIKGLEALTVECVMAAREFEAAEQVFASLDRTFPHMGWTADLPDYLVGRVAEHGRRRAAEMHEVERTLASVGVTPVMSRATAERQQRLVDAMATRDVRYTDAAFTWRALLEALDD